MAIDCLPYCLRDGNAVGCRHRLQLRRLVRWQAHRHCLLGHATLTESAPPEVVEELTSILVEFHPEGQLALFRSGWAEHDARDLLPEIKIPTLLLYGDRDARSPLDVAKEMHASIPGSTLVVMEGVGHESDMEAPDRFNAEVRRFLRSAHN